MPTPDPTDPQGIGEELNKWGSWGSDQIPRLQQSLGALGPNAQGKTITDILKSNSNQFGTIGDTAQYYDPRYGLDAFSGSNVLGRAYAALKDYGVNPEDYGVSMGGAQQLGQANASDWKSRSTDKSSILGELLPVLAGIAGPALGFAGLGAMGIGPAALGAGEGALAGLGGEAALSTGATDALAGGGLPWSQAYAGGDLGGSFMGLGAEGEGAGAAGSALAGGSSAGPTGWEWLDSVEPGGMLGSGTSAAGEIPAQFGAPLSNAASSALGIGNSLPSTPPTSMPGSSRSPSGGGGPVDTILDQLKKNALSLGLMGASLAGAGAKANTMSPAMKQLSNAGTPATNLAQDYIQRAQAGQLTGPQQASLDQYVQKAKNQVRQYFSSIGQFDSTSRIQAEQQIDQTGMALQAQMVQQTLDSGLKALGAGTGPLTEVARYQAGQDQALIQAMGNFAQGIGSLFGQQAGKGQTTTQPPAQPQKPAELTPLDMQQMD